MRRARFLVAMGLGAAVCTASVGLALSQGFPTPPPPPGYTPGVGYAPPGVEPPGPARAAPAVPSASGAPAAGSPTVALGGDAPPPEEQAQSAPPPADSNAEAVPLPTPEVKKGEPMKRPRFTSAILQAVDKTTAETLRFEAKVGEPVRFKGLVITVHACESTAPDEGYTDSIAHMDVQAQPDSLTPQPPRVIFRGWMFASAPGLHAVEHPLYDVWLIACKTAAPVAPGVNL